MTDPAHHLGLVLIDFQDGFLSVIPNRENLLKRACFAIEAAILLNCSIVVTEHVPEKLGHTTTSIQEALTNQSTVLAKSSFSAMEAEGIDDWIGQNQIDHLLLLGIETPICIYQTAIQALGSELGVTLLSDCIGERRLEDREPTLRQLLAMDANVLPSETIFYSLIGDATHPNFRAFTKLVKKYA